MSACLFNFYAEYMMRNAGLEDAQAGIKISGRNINNLIYAEDTMNITIVEAVYTVSLRKAGTPGSISIY